MKIIQIILKNLGNSSLSRIDSLDSEQDLFHTGKKNDKKSLFLKYGPIDGQLIFKYGIDARIEKKDLNRDRTFTILEEQKEQTFLKPQEVQRRKSAEGSLFGFMNKRIIQFDYLAPFHPNHKSPLKISKEKISSPIIDLSPTRRVKEAQKTRIFQKDANDSGNVDQKAQKRLSQVGKSNIFNNINVTINSNNNANTLDEIRIQERSPTIVPQSQQRNSRNGTLIKPIQLNQNLLLFDNQIQQQPQQQQSQSSIIREQSPSKLLQQYVLEEAMQIQERKKSEELKNEKHQTQVNIQKSKSNANQHEKQFSIQKQSNSNMKNRRTVTHTDFSDYHQNFKLQSTTTNKLIKQNEKEEYHLTPTNAALFFSVHKKSPSNQIIQKYMTTNGLANTPTGQLGFYDHIQQEKFLQSDGLVKNYHKKGNTGVKKEKLAPLNQHEKRVSKTSQQLFSQVYISQNPLYKKIAAKGKKVTLPELNSIKTINPNLPYNSQQNIDTQVEENNREPLSQKQLDDGNQISSSKQNRQQSKEQKKVENKTGHKSLHENSENRVIIRKQSLRIIKKQDHQQLNGSSSSKKVSIPIIK